MSEEIDIQDLPGVIEEVREQFDGIDYRPVFGEIVDDLEESHAGYFAQQRSPDGSPWPALAESTVRRKGHDTILFESGALEASLGGLSSDSIREIEQEGGNAGMVFGTNVPYAACHQRGGRLPKREHVGTNEQQVDEMANLIADHIIEGLKQ